MILIIKLKRDVNILKRKNNNLIISLSGLALGFINGIFGAGGGMIAVPLLKKLGFSQKEAHENAVAIILPITVLSAILYLAKDYVNFKESLVYLPTGLTGALAGTFIMKKISGNLLKKIFSCVLIYAGARLLLK